MRRCAGEVREMPVLFLPVFSSLRRYPQQNYHPLFAPGTRLKSLREFCTPQPDVFNLHHKAVILSEAPRRSIAYRRVYGAESKDPGDACWQMLFGAFRPRTIRRVKKVTSSERTRISYSPRSPATTYVVLPKENQMQLSEAATLDRKIRGSRPVPACRGRTACPRNLEKLRKIAARSRICVSPLDIRQVKSYFLVGCRG
jgi:hypothetical protein